MNFKKKDLISNHLKRSKVTHLKVWTWSLSIEFFVSLKYIRFRQRLMCLRTVLPLLIQLFTWIKMSRYTDSKRKHQNTPKFIQIKTIWSLNKFGHHKCLKDIQNVKNVRFLMSLRVECVTVEIIIDHGTINCCGIFKSSIFATETPVLRFYQPAICF